jgi:outer membrane lipoprotein LolB
LGEAFHLLGRVSVRQGEEAFSGTLDWWHRPAGDEVEILGPLGQGVARLVRTPQGASLTTARGEVHTALDVEELTARLLGWRLPLAALAHWVQGAPGTGAGGGNGICGGWGRLARLVQEGWRIEYGAWREAPGLALPGRLDVEGRDLRLRLVVDAWQ